MEVMHMVNILDLIVENRRYFRIYQLKLYKNVKIFQEPDKTFFFYFSILFPAFEKSKIYFYYMKQLNEITMAQ